MSDATKIENVVPFNEMFVEAYIPYALTTMLHRALRFADDGLKPVHRRILYTMLQEKLFNNKARTKSANVSGATAKLHPHGDQSIYPAMVRLAQWWSLRVPLIDGHGCFGSLDDGPAAMRYTEVRLSKAGEMLLEDTIPEIVDFIDSATGNIQEPYLLGSKFPNVLINGDEGIAVSISSVTPCHNPSEVCEAVRLFLRNPKATVQELKAIMPGPDFPTGGFIFDDGSIEQYYTTGSGSVVMQGKATIDDGGGKPTITISELPYQVGPAEIMKDIAKALEGQKSDVLTAAINDFNDYQDVFNPVKIVIEIKPGHNPNAVIEELYRHTQLRCNLPINQNVVLDKRPALVSTIGLIEAYITHRRNIVTKRTQYLLSKAEDRKRRVDAYIIAIAHGEEVISIIRKNRDKEKRMKQLAEILTLDAEQLEFVVGMTVNMFSPEQADEFKKEQRQLSATIKDYKDILSKPTRIDDIINIELDEVKAAVGDKRRTQIITGTPKQLTTESLVTEIPMTVMINWDGTGKITTRFNSGLTEREQGFVKELLHCSNCDRLMAITRDGNCISAPVHSFPVSDRRKVGDKIFDIDNIVSYVVIPKDNEGYVSIITRGGKIKRSVMSEYIGSSHRSMQSIKLADGDKVVDAIAHGDDGDFLIVTDMGAAVRYPISLVNSVGRVSQGVAGLSSKAGHPLSLLVVNDDKSELFVINEQGAGKRMSLTEIQPSKGRVSTGINVLRSLIVRTVGACLLKKNSVFSVISNDSKSMTYDYSSTCLANRIAKPKLLLCVIGNQKVSNVRTVG